MTVALMKLDLAAPHTVYKTADGKRAPGVTTVLGVLDKAALLPWAAGLERALVLEHAGAGTLDALPRQYAFEAKRDKAADLGTITHARIEAWLKGTELDPDGLPADLYAESVHGYERFREWWFGEGLQVVASELPLVSERYRVGGTLDVVARDAAGELVLVDIKTSNATRTWPYPSVIGQVAAYRALWGEHNSQRIGRVAVARVGKTPGDEGQQLWLSDTRLDNGLALFVAALDAYRAMQALGRAER